MKGRHLLRRNAPSFDFIAVSRHFDTTFSVLRGLYSLVPLLAAGTRENRPMLLTRFIALLQDAPTPPASSAQSMVRIVAGVLALVLVIVIIMRRKSKGKKDEEEEEF
jgi:hypothetical protein